MSIDITKFDFDDKSLRVRMDFPGVSVNRQFVAIFNRKATDIINEREYRYCRVGVTNGEVLFSFCKLQKDGCRKVLGSGTGQVRVSLRGRRFRQYGIDPHAAVPVEIDGDYFIAKFD